MHIYIYSIVVPRSTPLLYLLFVCCFGCKVVITVSKLGHVFIVETYSDDRYNYVFGILLIMGRYVRPPKRAHAISMLIGSMFSSVLGKSLSWSLNTQLFNHTPEIY